MKFSLHIFEIMKVVDACRYHIVRMNHTLHFADSMEFIIIIMHSLRSIISLVRYSVRIVPLHDVSFDACVQANLYRFGINTAPVNRNYHNLCGFLWQGELSVCAGR